MPDPAHEQYGSVSIQGDEKGLRAGFGAHHDERDAPENSADAGNRRDGNRLPRFGGRLKGADIQHFFALRIAESTRRQRNDAEHNQENTDELQIAPPCG